MTDSSNNKMIPQGDGWDSVPPEPERFTKGRTIKFRDGAYFINRNEPILADELQLLVIGVCVAWVRWEDGWPVEHRITGPHQRHPEREQLSHRDESEWPIGFGDKPADPWRDTRYIYLLDLKTAEEYTFVTETYGGRRAVGDLANQITKVRCATLARFRSFRCRANRCRPRRGRGRSHTSRCWNGARARMEAARRRARMRHCRPRGRPSSMTNPILNEGVRTPRGRSHPSTCSPRPCALALIGHAQQNQHGARRKRELLRAWRHGELARWWR